MLTRRRLIHASGAIMAASAVSGGAGFELLSLGGAAPGHLALSARELLLVQALAEALFPPGNALGVTAFGMDLGPEVDELMGDRLDPVVAPAFRYALKGLDHGTWLSRGARFADLPIADRVAVMNAWAEPEVTARRLTYDVLRTVVGMVFFCRPEVTQTIGWRPPCAIQLVANSPGAAL